MHPEIPAASFSSFSAKTVEPRLVVIDGVTLRIAETQGEAGRPPLVMFNGIGANLELLQPFLDVLDPRIPTLRFDVPGTGGSPTARWPYRFPGLARTVDRLCTQLGYGEVDVFGISWGGAMAQQFAHQFPQRTRRLVLAATSAGMFMVPASPRVLLKMISPQRYFRPTYLREVAGTIYGGDFRRDPALVGQFLRLIKPGTFLGYLMQLFAGWLWTSIFWLRGLRQPTLVMAGADDPLTPPINSRLLAWLIPHARLVTFDCGHLFLLTRRVKVAAEMGPFLLAE